MDIPDQIYSSISDKGAGLNKFIPRSEDFIETLKYSVEGTPDYTFISCFLTHDELLNVSSEIRIELMDITDKTHVKDPLPMNSIDLSLLLPSIAAIIPVLLDTQPYDFHLKASSVSTLTTLRLKVSA